MILCCEKVFAKGTENKTYLLVISKNDYLPMSYLELQLNLLSNIFDFTTRNNKLLGIDLLTDVEIEIKSELEDLDIKGCSESFNYRKLLSREE